MATITVRDSVYTLTDDVKIVVYYYKDKEPVVKLDGIDYVEIQGNQTVSTIAADLSANGSYYFGTGLMSDNGRFIPCSTQHLPGYSSVGITAISDTAAKAFFGRKKMTEKLVDKIYSLLWVVNRKSYDRSEKLI